MADYNWLLEPQEEGTNPTNPPAPVGPDYSHILQPQKPSGPNYDHILRTDPAAPKQTTGANPFEVIQNYKGPITQEAIAASPDLMEVVYQSWESRGKHANTTLANRAATGVTGGQTFGGDSIRDMPPEEAVELWQNYQRSFAGGQTVTTANELVYLKNADAETRRKVGAGYHLFDNMENIFTGEGSWGDTFDAIGDYTKAAIWDPTTILSFGVGRALTGAGTKTSVTLARAAIKKEAMAAVRRGVPKGLAKAGASAKVAKIWAKDALKYSAVDIAANMASDVAYQKAKMMTPAQEEYSFAQTAMVTAGSVAIPAIMAASGMLKAGRTKLGEAGVGPDWAKYAEIEEEIIQQGKKKAPDIVRDKTDLTKVRANLKAQFGSLGDESDDFLYWGDLKKQAGDIVNKKGERATDAEVLNGFKEFFLFGDKTRQGYAQSLSEAGFIPARELMEEAGTITGLYAQTIKWLPEGVVREAAEAFEKATGRKVSNQIDLTNEGFAAHLTKGASDAGSTLQISSKLAKMSKEEVEVLVANKVKEADKPKYIQFALSTYKRLLTSHLATTGANLKGFNFLTVMNSISDVYLAAGRSAAWAMHKGMGNEVGAQKAAFDVTGLLGGNAFKASNMFSPDMTFKFAEAVFNLNPKAREKLFRDVSGDGGVLDSLSTFNIPETSKLWGGVDTVTARAQALTGVRMQDDITKKWAFESNFDIALRREYGKSSREFFKSPENIVEMYSPRFQERVLEKAVFRTLRETASVNWSTLPAAGAMRSAAKFIEQVTNRTPIGFIVPFGSFMNTTIATMADYTGINALRFYMSKALGKELDFVTQEGAESIAKAAAGWTVILAGVPMAKERIKQGLSWNQNVDEEGDLKDVTFDWPASTIRLMSQMFGHAENQSGDWDFSKVPDDLWRELGVQLGSQAARDLDDFWKTIDTAFGEIKDSGSMPEALGEFLGPLASRIAQGITRPLDPLNQLTGLVKGNKMNPDLRQGAKNFNEATKYFNHIFDAGQLIGNKPVQDLPIRKQPTSTPDDYTDLGKQLLGVRIDKPNSLYEQMLNTTGRTHWNQVRWDGPPEIKNYMDAMAQEYFDAAAERAIARYPNFQDLPSKTQNGIIDKINKDVKKQVLDHLEMAPIAKTFNAIRVLSQDKTKVKKAMDMLGMEGNLEDFIEEEGGLEKLMQIKSLVDRLDDIFDVEIE